MSKKILWISDSIFYPSSLGKVSKQIISELLATKQYEVYHFGFQNQKGSNLQYGDLTILESGKSRLHGEEVVKQAIREYDIDIIVDYAGCTHIPKRFYVYLMDRQNAKLVTYPFVDNSPPSRLEVELLKKADCVVPPTEFLRAELLKVEPNLEDRISEPILHPIDLELYKPMKKQEARKSLFKNDYNIDYNIVKDKFIVSFVGANQWRKGIIELFASFSLFLKKFPDALLLMVTNPHPEPMLEFDGGFDLGVEALRYKIEDNLLVLPFVPEELMPAVYNASDLFFLPTHGGVTELPIIEAMACGIPVLTTDAAVMRYWIEQSKGGMGIKVARKIPLTIPMKMFLHPNAFDTLGNYPELLEGIFGKGFFGYSFVSDIEDAAEKMKQLASSPKLRNELGRKGVKYIRSLPIRPAEVCSGWTRVFEKAGKE